jgi:hypothetical protein
MQSRIHDCTIGPCSADRNALLAFARPICYLYLLPSL